MIDNSTMPIPKNVLSTMPIAASSFVRVQREMNVTRPTPIKPLINAPTSKYE